MATANLATTECSTKFEAFRELLAARGKIPKRPWHKYYYDKSAALRAVRFIENYCRHAEGKGHAGKKFKLEWWQKSLIMQFFGWLHWDTGHRRYRVLFLFLPKKNGKSMIAAAITAYGQYADREPGAHCVIVASDKAQAGEMFNMVTNIVKMEPRLDSRSKCFKNLIYVPRNVGTMRVVSKKPGGKHAPNWHVVMVDECHAIEKKETVDALTAGTVARTQPITGYLSTAGFDRTHWYYAVYNYAKSIARGARRGGVDNDQWLVRIYEIPPEVLKEDKDAWKKKEWWYKANPNLGITIQLEEFERMFEEACQLPTELNKFKRLHLNIWTESAVQAIPMDRWALCFKTEEESPLAKLKGQTCFAAVDLSATTDFTSRLLLFPPQYGRTWWEILAHYWFPEANLKLREQRLQGVDPNPWLSAGVLSLTPGEVVDYDGVLVQLEEDRKLYNIRRIAIDPHEATHLTTLLMNAGFEVVRVVHRYSTLNDATKNMLALILKQELNHRNNPMLSWNAANLATCQNPRGNIMPDKAQSKEKIDGISCLVMALSQALVSPVLTSIYETRGLITV